jgi:membrane dipeptidase
MALGIDLHCDLLSYLAAWPGHTPYDEGSVANLHFAEQGGIGTLILALFTPTKPGCEKVFEPQMKFFKELSSTIKFIPAIENASCFIGEEEPFEKAIQRLKSAGQKFLYLTMTWNGENRFGGGVGSDKGLTEQGKALLDAIPPFFTAIDFSHTSDRLARDILNYLDQTKSPLKVLASHSNFRSIQDVPRNLPEDIAEEIVRRGGIIGLNLIRNFVGPRADSFFDHMEYALKKGWEKHVALGADFFDIDFEHSPNYDMPKEVQDLPVSQRHAKFLEEHFFPEYPDASSLKLLVREISQRYGEAVAEAFWWKNAKSNLLVIGNL